MSEIIEPTKMHEGLKKYFEEIVEKIELLTANADRYLGKVVNFLMWTSAISFAIIAWFATNFLPNSPTKSLLGIFGLTFIIASFCVSIYTIGEILKYWELTWRSTNRLYQASFLLIREPEESVSDIFERFKSTMLSSESDAKKRNEWVEKFPLRTMVIIHLILLGIGLGFYSFTVFI